MAIVGQNDSGKTTTAIVLLERCAYQAPVFIIDTKPEEDLEQLPGRVYTDPSDALGSDHWVTIYRPADQYNSAPQIDMFLRALYAQERPQLYLYIDETFSATRGARPDEGIADVLMRGRKRMSRNTPGLTCRMSVIASSQSPRWIPLTVWRESRHFFVHFLQDREDRLRVTAWTGYPKQIADTPVKGHEFYYHRANVDNLPPEKFQWEL